MRFIGTRRHEKNGQTVFYVGDFDDFDCEPTPSIHILQMKLNKTKNQIKHSD